MVASKGSPRQQQTISTAPGPLLSLSPLPTPMGWQTPAPQSHLWHLRLETQRAWLQTPGRTDDPELGKTGASKSPPFIKTSKIGGFCKTILKLPRFFTSFETWVSELCLIGSVAKRFPSLTRTLGTQRGKYCPATISLPSHRVLFSWCCHQAWLYTAMDVPTHPWDGLHLGGTEG